MFRYSLVLLAGLGMVGPAVAGTWADALFEELSKDFGSVPRGPTLQHPFRVKNNTNGVVTISNVRVSCGCTTAHALKTQLNPGEETAILAQMDTTRFSGLKTVTIYVQFGQPGFEEVRLWVQANGRDDVSVSPDTLALGRAKRGSSPSATTTITFLGQPQSQILEAKSDSNYVLASFKEVGREGVEARYQLTARIRPDTPVGKWFTDIWVKTNNPAMPRVRVPLTVEIESALSLSPAAVSLGQVQVGGEVERKLVLRGAKPFKVTGVRGTDSQLSVRASTAESKQVHVLTVTLKGRQPGELERTLRIVTDLPEDNEIDFLAKGQVLPQSQQNGDR
jgi:hypothetical protein